MSILFIFRTNTFKYEEVCKNLTYRDIPKGMYVFVLFNYMRYDTELVIIPIMAAVSY